MQLVFLLVPEVDIIRDDTAAGGSSPPPSERSVGKIFESSVEKTLQILSLPFLHESTELKNVLAFRDKHQFNNNNAKTFWALFSSMLVQLVGQLVFQTNGEPLGGKYRSRNKKDLVEAILRVHFEESHTIFCYDDVSRALGILFSLVSQHSPLRELVDPVLSFVELQNLAQKLMQITLHEHEFVLESKFNFLAFSSIQEFVSAMVKQGTKGLQVVDNDGNEVPISYEQIFKLIGSQRYLEKIKQTVFQVFENEGQEDLHYNNLLQILFSSIAYSLPYVETEKNFKLHPFSSSNSFQQLTLKNSTSRRATAKLSKYVWPEESHKIGYRWDCLGRMKVNLAGFLD